jgi:hypothetical protein
MIKTIFVILIIYYPVIINSQGNNRSDSVNFNTLLVLDDETSSFHTFNSNADSNISFLTRWGDGLCKTIISDGKYIFKGHTGIIYIHDISELNYLKEISKIEIPGSIQQIIYSDNKLYVAGGTSGLIIIDISDIITPKFIAQYQYSSFLRSIALSDNYIFAATGWDGLQVTDIINLDSIHVVGIEHSIYYHDFYIKQHVAYVSANDGFHLVDISNPLFPKYINGIGISQADGLVKDVLVKDNFAYLTTENSILIVDVENPDSLSIINTHSLSEPNSLSINGENLFVSYANGMNIYDINDPMNLNIIGSFYSKYSAYDLQIVDNSVLYLANGINGLIVLDINDIHNPVVRNYIENNSGNIRDIVVKDDLAYIADKDQGLIILSLADQRNPQKVSSFDCDAEIVIIEKEYAYVGSYYSGLYIFNISNPQSPELVFTEDVIGVSDLKISGDYLYIINITDFYSFSIKNPADPIQLDKISYFGGKGFRIYREYAYLWSHKDLQIISIADPYELKYINTFDDLEINHLEISENVAYASSYSDLLSVFDIKNPVNPTKISKYTSDQIENITDLFIRGNELFVTDWFNGVFIFNIRKSESLKILGRYKTPLGQKKIFAMDELLYIANGYDGLIILKSDIKVNEPINDNTSISLISFSPNPFHNDAILSFWIHSEQELSVTIFDILGRKIKKIADNFYLPGQQTMKINLNVLASGIYICEIKSKSYNENHAIKILKIN